MNEGDKIRIAPSILSADFSRLGEEVRAVVDAGADLIHVDVMDGRFVPPITVGPLVVEAVRRVTDGKVPLDVHLMVAEPESQMEDFARAGADWISVHAETVRHLHGTLQALKTLGVRAGVAVNPGTPLAAVEEVLEEADYLLVMSVNPGFAGQRFIPSSLGKLARLRAMLEERGLGSVGIEVDGGIKEDNIARVAAAGARSFVAGSAVFGGGDPGEKLRALRKAAQGGAG